LTYTWLEKDAEPDFLRQKGSYAYQLPVMGQTDKQQKTWNPETDGHVFVMVDSSPTDPHSSTYLQFEFGSVSIHMRSESEGDEWFNKIKT
jgi:hypothetical protein